MFEKIHRVDPELIKSVEWNGNAEEYDTALSTLGDGKKEFLVINPYHDNQSYIHFISGMPNTEKKAILWQFDNLWLVKLFRKGWKPSDGFEIVNVVKPKLTWQKNQDIDRLMKFENDPFAKYEPEPWDYQYKLIWYMDPRFNPLEEKVWAITCEPMGGKTKGTKDMGYVMPLVEVEVNPDLPDLDLDVNDYCPAYFDLLDENVWKINPKHATDKDKDVWVFKFRPSYRRPRFETWYGQVTPEFDIVTNPDLPELGYNLDYNIPWHDLGYEHVWFLDKKFLQNNESDIWAVKIVPKHPIIGTKNMGYIEPEFEVEFNQDLPDLNYDLDYVPPWYDLGYEHIWFLDKKFLQNEEEDIWAIKVKFLDEPVGSKTIDYIEPSVNIVYNSNLPKMTYDIDYDIPWHDFKYEHVVYLDPKHLQNGEEDIWAVKYSLVQNPQGSKNIGYISPRHSYEYNSDLPKMDFTVDYDIPWHDFKYEHIWYLDSKFAPNNQEDIWAVKVRTTLDVQGQTAMGFISPLFTEYLDVIFISYNEPNAEENWQRVLEKAPWAKRVDGVKGIFEAHKQAALLSNTDMFYVVDGDAWLVDDWQFDYQPGIFDRDCAYIWHSLNPLNNLEYGYGGVKLFSKALMLKAKGMTKLDMTTSVMPKLKIMDKISNETRFNVDKFSTWRSAFRECVKLYYNSRVDSKNTEHKERLEQWLHSQEGNFSKYAVRGAEMAVEYVNANIANYDLLLNINDMSWLKKEFKKLGKL